MNISAIVYHLRHIVLHYKYCMLTTSYSTGYVDMRNSSIMTKLAISEMHSPKVTMCWCAKFKSKLKNGPPGRLEGSCLMVERHEGVEGWNCLLMESLSPSCESCSCLLVLRQIEVADVGGHSIQTTANIFPCTLFGYNKLILVRLGRSGMQLGAG